MISAARTLLKTHKSVIRQAFAHLAYQGGAMLLPLVLLPVVTHLLPPEQYGVNALYMSVVTLVGAVMSMGVDQVIANGHFKNSVLQQRRLVGSYLCLLLFFFLVFESGVVLFRQVVGDMMEISAYSALTLGFLPCLIAIVVIGQVVTMLDKQLKLQGIFILGRPIMTYAISLPLLFFLGGHWYFLVAGALFAYTVLSVTSLLYLKKKNLLSFKPVPAAYSQIGIMGSAVLMNNLTFQVTSLVERFSIEHFTNAHQVGLYALMNTMLLAVTLAFSALGRVTAPWVIKNITTGTVRSYRGIVHLLYAYSLAIVLVFTVAAVLAGPLVHLLINATYADAALVAPYLAFSVMFYTLFIFSSGLLIYNRKAWVVAIISVVGTLLNMGLNLLLVPSLGVQGAAIAGIISYGLIFASTFYLIVKFTPYPWGTEALWALKTVLAVFPKSRSST